MKEFNAANPDFRDDILENFEKQLFMSLLGAKPGKVQPGYMEIEIPFKAELTQQHGFLHAGVMASLMDSACGYAAFSLMPADSDVLSIEYKVNMLRPAKGDSFLASGTVIKPGKSIYVCQGEAYAINGDKRKLVATMSATMMAVAGRSDL